MLSAFFFSFIEEIPLQNKMKSGSFIKKMSKRAGSYKIISCKIGLGVKIWE